MPEIIDEAREALQMLATKVSNELGKGLSAGTLIPQEIVVERWKLTGSLRYGIADERVTRNESNQTHTVSTTPCARALSSHWNASWSAAAVLPTN